MFGTTASQRTKLPTDITGSRAVSKRTGAEEAFTSVSASPFGEREKDFASSATLGTLPLTTTMKSSRRKELSVADMIDQFLSLPYTDPTEFLGKRYFYCVPTYVLDWVERSQAMFKFVYLGYKKESKLGTKCIYDLEVLSSERVNWEEYFTLSPEGLTHYRVDKMGMFLFSAII